LFTLQNKVILISYLSSVNLVETLGKYLHLCICYNYFCLSLNQIKKLLWSLN